MNILMVTGGETDIALLKDIYKNYSTDPYVIGVDKGCGALETAGIPIDFAIGDFDSLGRESKERLAPKDGMVELNPVKDDTDTEAAIAAAISKKPDSITIIGATGNRIDHMLANLFLLGKFMEAGINALIVDSYNRVRLIDGEFIVKKEEVFGDYISLIPYGDKVESLTMKGFKYETENLRLEKCSSRGISNELMAERGIISLIGPAILVESKDRV